MLHLRYVNGKRGGLNIPMLDDHSGPQLDKRDREDQSSQSDPSKKQMRAVQVIIQSKNGRIMASKDYTDRVSFYNIYSSFYPSRILHPENSYVIFLDRAQSKFLCPGFHFSLNEIIEGDKPLILTELKRTELEQEVKRLEVVLTIVRQEKFFEVVKLLNVAKGYLNKLYQLKNIVGLHFSILNDAPKDPSRGMREWWIDLFSNLFQLNRNCVNVVKNYMSLEKTLETKIGSKLLQNNREMKIFQFQTWIDQLKASPFSELELPEQLKTLINEDTQLWFRDQVKAGNLFQPPPLVIDEDTLPCVKPGNLDLTHLQIGSPEEDFENIFLLKHIYFNNGERVVTYSFRDVNASIRYIRSMPEVDFIDPIFRSEVPMSVYEKLLKMAANPRRTPDVNIEAIPMMQIIDYDDTKKTQLYTRMQDNYEEQRNMKVDYTLYFNMDYTTFDCSNRKIRVLPDILNQYVYLKKFDCSNNYLDAFPILDNLLNLEEFNCSSNSNLYLVPKFIFYLSNLKSLNCSNIQLERLTEPMLELKQLEEFNCSNNHLGTLPESISSLSNLKTLNCSSNRLSKLPISIGHLEKLEVFDCSINQVTELPKSIGALAKLKVFDCSRNFLYLFPAAIGNLSNLVEFHCVKTALTKLPAEIGSLTNLKKLYCSFNDLTELPASIGDLSNLEEFDCSINKLTALPAEIGNLSNLKFLNLTGNKLTALPSSLGKRVKLKISLARNLFPEEYGVTWPKLTKHLRDLAKKEKETDLIKKRGPDHSKLPLEIDEQSEFKPDLTKKESAETGSFYFFT